MTRRPPIDPDARRVRRSALRIGLQVAGVAVALVVVIIGLVIAYVLWQSTPFEQLERHPNATRIYVDTRDLLVALVVIGLAAVLVAGFATWRVARRAVGPLGAALRRQREFVADASHELRTPLAVLNARVQLLERRLGPDDPASAVVTELRADARVLVDIVDDLLTAASADTDQGRPSADTGLGRPPAARYGPAAHTAGDPSTSPERAASPGTRPQQDPGRVGTAVALAVRDLALLAEARGIRIERTHTDEEHVSAGPDAAVTVPAAALRRCIVALLDNAVRHSPDGGVVSVATTNVSGAVLVHVIDHGSGIVGVDPARVFDRFVHTAPPSTSPDALRGAHGIGLALVRDVVTRHGGSVAVAATGPTGTTFVLELPRST